jgi:hypothetical protein
MGATTLGPFPVDLLSRSAVVRNSPPIPGVRIHAPCHQKALVRISNRFHVTPVSDCQPPLVKAQIGTGAAWPSV